MHTHNATLYPMLAVGAFMAMFWTGIVAGHALGLGCFPLFATGLLSACLGTIGVCELERRDRRGTVVAPRERVCGAVSPSGARSAAPVGATRSPRSDVAVADARLGTRAC